MYKFARSKWQVESDEFSDDELLSIIDTLWTKKQVNRIAELNDKAQRTGHLTEVEAIEQEKLGIIYEQGVLRRTEVIEALRQRGYDLSELLQRTSVK